MLQQEAMIVNKLGLHARAAAKLTQLAARYQCGIWLTRNGRRVNAKSIMGVMLLAAGMGSILQIETDGADEAEAMQAIRTQSMTNSSGASARTAATRNLPRRLSRPGESRCRSGRSVDRQYSDARSSTCHRLKHFRRAAARFESLLRMMPL